MNTLPMRIRITIICLSISAGVQAETVSGGGIALSVGADGRISSLRIAGRETAGNAPSAPLVTLCDVTRNKVFVPGVPTGGDLATGLRVDFGAAQATAAIHCQDSDAALTFTCDLRGASDLAARGVLLRFAFPLNAIGWRWHDDMQTARDIAGERTYENVRPLRIWADLPEWADQPALRMGYSNRNFCTVLTGPVGVCLSVPLDRPGIFRTAYDAKARQLQLVYDLALSPDTGEPNAASFAFELSACDPQWGFRSALADYYRRHPEMFVRRVAGPGQWMAFNRLSQVVHANDYCFGLQEGAAEPDYDDKLGVLSCTYFTHAGQFANIPDYDPEHDPLPPHEIQVKAMAAAFTRRTGITGIYQQVGLYDADEKLDIHKARVYGHLIAQFNLDPDLTYGAWHLKRTAEQTKSIKERTGGDLDGFYYDGLTAGINYRRDHFRCAAAPPLWDPVNRKPFLNNFFGACEFARAAAQLLRPRGQITMMNGAIGASFFVAPWLDVFGSETGLRISRENLNYIRSIVYQKPYLTLLKGNYEQKIGHADIELFMKRALAYGIFPGFFDWPPSGLGPGGRYWDHPEYYLRDYDLHHRYQPLCRTLADAGWEPVTHARSSNERVFVERFGPAGDGVVWLTLLNEDVQPHTTTLTIEPRPLGLDVSQLQCVDILTDEVVNVSRHGDTLMAELEVAADGVAMLQLCSPRQAALWRLRRAAELVGRDIRTRELEADTPPRAVYWRPEEGGYLRQEGLVLSGARRVARACSQWAMLFQPEPAPVKLTIRAAAENLAGKGKVQIHCRTAWVSSSFTHYATQAFELPKGSYAERDYEFVIESNHPLRAILLTPRMDANVTGKLRLRSIRLADRFGDDYVEDPDFSTWVVQPPAETRTQLMREGRQLLAALEGARSAADDDLASPATRQALLDASSRCQLLHQRLRRASRGPDTAHLRHFMDDLSNTVAHDLTVCLIRACGGAMPRLSGPQRVAPGDAVRLTLDAASLPGLPLTVTWSAPGATLDQAANKARLTIPASAEAGNEFECAATLRYGPAERSAELILRHHLTVVDPLELSLASLGADTESGALRVVASVRNNRTRPTPVELELRPPPGWRPLTTRVGFVPAGGSRDAALEIAPAGPGRAGVIDIRATARAGQDIATAAKTMLYIPQDANLLRNPGFEQGARGWSGIGGAITIDHGSAHSGKASVCLRNRTARQSTVSQSVVLNQKRSCPILVRAASRGENVSGKPDRGYSLYIDIYYTDGTPLYGRTHNFNTGTTDWQLGELCIEPEKPIRNVNVYLLLRGKTGVAWFDDIAVVEDPRRRGNLARQAQVTVDSSYAGYDAEPLTDGIIYPSADVHWSDESWASAETAREHFIQLDFPDPVVVSRAVVYWSLDAGIPRTSVEVRLQVKAGAGWRTVARASPSAPRPQTMMRLDRPVTANQFRFLQPAGQGPSARPNLMWVREVELFPPAADR